MRAVGVQGTVCQVGQWSESGAQAALVDELKGALSNDVSVVEVVAHPGYFDDDLLQATPEPWARCRPVNLETLIALCSEGLYSSLGLQLASFSDAFI
jgi:predicted aminopeptidase